MTKIVIEKKYATFFLNMTKPMPNIFNYTLSAEMGNILRYLFGLFAFSA
jgi:hypothetical protein